MYDILCITNRRLCKEDFLKRIRRIAENHPKAIVLREKDLTPDEYRSLAEQVMSICKECGTVCILHSFADIAAELGADGIHLPLHILRELDDVTKRKFRIIGASCHSVGDAREAQRQGAAYITAGHVFATDCKKGLPPRGLDFLREVCAAVSIPVYAIAGISAGNYGSVIDARAAGACIMSGLMTADDPREYLQRFREESDSE
jgi:thiamine-phosphate pyrophosphorylase